MQFVLFGRIRPNTFPLAWTIFQANGRTKRDFRRARDEEYCAMLVDGQKTILAECTISPQWTLFSTDVHQYVLYDVFVPKVHRGNGYAIALILNILYELGPTPMYLQAYRKNVSAMRCYRKIFGAPRHVGQRLATFASGPLDFWTRFWLNVF
jgi:hypothetical protein